MSDPHMNFAIDLLPKQIARVLEQFVRSRAPIELEFRPRHGPDRIRGVFAGRDGGQLLVELIGAAPSDLSELVGACADAEVDLGGERFVFPSALTGLDEAPGAQHVRITTPEAIQVLNRRRFERTTATLASQVRISVPTHEPAFVGLLVNVGGSGIAVNLPGTDAGEHIYLGDRVFVTFEIAGFEDHYSLPCLVCNKSASRADELLSLGLMFDVSPSDPPACDALRRVRHAIAEIMISNLDLDGTQ